MCIYFSTNLDEGDDTCTEKPLDQYSPLSTGCNVDIDGESQSRVNVGKCSNQACSRRDHPEDVDTHCCGIIETDSIVVTCPYIEYDMKVAKKCGCTECSVSRSKQTVTVVGQIYLVTFDESGEEILTKPGKLITFYVRGKEHNAIAGGSFLFSMEPTGNKIALQFPAKDSYMSQVVSVGLVNNVDEYTVTVKLPPKPAPVHIDPAVENTIQSSWENHGSVYDLVIPPNSFVDLEGNIVTEDVDFYVTFMDPTDGSSISLAPGEFSFIDDEGKESGLVTYGVINMEAAKKSGEKVGRSGQLVLKLDSDALGLKADQIRDTFVWQTDFDSGGWIDPNPLTVSNSKATKKRAELESVIDADVPSWNVDRSHFDEGCRVAVVAKDYYGVEEIDGVSFEVHTMLSGDCICKTVTEQTAGPNGKVCGLVECGNTFEIVSLSPDFKPGMHSLPNDTVYENDPDTGHILGIATDYEDITDARGPVHRYETESCEQINKMFSGIHYFFVFNEQTINTLSKSSRSADFNNGRVCFIRANYVVSNPSFTHLFLIRNRINPNF